jgi:hypothetical protein
MKSFLITYLKNSSKRLNDCTVNYFVIGRIKVRTYCGRGEVPEETLLWIRIQEGKNDPEKYKTVNKLHLLKFWMFAFGG